MAERARNPGGSSSDGGGDGGASTVAAVRVLQVLQRAFPNRVTLHAPHAEAEAAAFKASLERDVAASREVANRRCLGAVLAKCGIGCPSLEGVAVR